jgi:FlaA1/EpsC-like NDP-sugar epimerase
VQPVQITDLLSREEIHLNNEAILNLIKDEVVLITGGGGSIGSELTRQVASMKPKQVIIYDIYENTAYNVQTELEHRYKKNQIKLDLKVIIGSVYNKERLESIFTQYRPTLVFHAAAYKHVPLMEESAVEALRTNVLGTHFVSELSIKYHVKKMILVSSDKAVRPTNIMGATKRLAEKIIQTAQKILSQPLLRR